MKTTDPANILNPRLSNDQSIASTNDPTVAEMGETWDTGTIVDLIRRNTCVVHQPSLLLLGERELEMLHRHLVKAFGEGTVSTGQQLYYVGMKVVAIKTPSLVKVAGEKLSYQMEHLAMRRSAFNSPKESRWFYHA